MAHGIFEVIEDALALAGYKILDGDNDTVIVRHPTSGMDYEIKVSEVR